MNETLDRVYEIVKESMADLVNSPCPAADLRQKIQKVNDEIIERITKEVPRFTVEVSNPPPRIYRKRKRWDERNRRKKLKGLPTKNNPYWSTFYYTVNEIVPFVTCQFLIDDAAEKRFWENQERLNDLLDQAHIDGPNVVRIGTAKEDGREQD